MNEQAAMDLSGSRWGFLGAAAAEDGSHDQEDQEEGQQDGDQDWQDQQEEVDHKVYKSRPEADEGLDGVTGYALGFPAADLDGLDGFFSDQGDADGRKIRGLFVVLDLAFDHFDLLIVGLEL